MPLEIVPPGTSIDFIGKWKICVAISLAVILISLLAIPVRGLRMGLDFAGGMEIQTKFAPEVKVEEGVIRNTVTATGMPEVSVVRYGESDESSYLIRFRAESAGAQGELVDQIRDALATNVGPVEIERVEFVGPRVGQDLQRSGIKALVYSSLAILIFIAFRFSPRYAPGAVVALVHDIVVTSGVFVLLGREFDLTVLAALLAILGYSLNDTIIVYDRIRENLASHTKQDLVSVLNLSVNQTLSRTILTSGTTFLAVLALLILGGEVIRPFALAMVIGIVVGTYSSIYIAAPMLLWLERRFGKPADKTKPAAAKGGKAPARA